jgi:hypothetical protein
MNNNGSEYGSIGPGVAAPKNDSTTMALNTIDYAHHEIHAGSSYEIETNDLDLDTDEALIVAFKTPNVSNKWMHCVAFYGVTGEAIGEILEAPTITVDTGSDLVAFNKNRNSINISDISTIETVPELGKATKNPTITADGTIISNVTIGEGRNRQSGESRDVLEWILKENTIYAFRITSKADNNIVQLSLVWYEHTNL